MPKRVQMYLVALAAVIAPPAMFTSLTLLYPRLFSQSQAGPFIMFTTLALLVIGVYLVYPEQFNRPDWRAQEARKDQAPKREPHGP